MGEGLLTVGGVEKLILKLTSPSTVVGVEARAELGNYQVSSTQNNNIYLILSLSSLIYCSVYLHVMDTRY